MGVADVRGFEAAGDDVGLALSAVEEPAGLGGEFGPVSCPVGMGQADDIRGSAELSEWKRIDRLLADAVPGTVHDPDTDDVVQAELASDAAAARWGEDQEVGSAAERSGFRGGHGADTSGRQGAAAHDSLLGGHT
ncbi:hypothetical protein ACFYPN_23135 [Streptomyces sp. NPDC005576]|uniref:hypothetical protein n=1 Tax=Streptomyces sp. NPDC005576 TaxID=3364726 RepID=UPI0036C4939A